MAAEAVLAQIPELMRGAQELPTALTFVCVPWASPDGLGALGAFDGSSAGTNARPVDDDGDGIADEDGADDVLVVCGGVIPPQDHAWLRDQGVAAVYGPGTNIPAAAAEIMKLIRKDRLAA